MTDKPKPVVLTNQLIARGKPQPCQRIPAGTPMIGNMPAAWHREPGQRGRDVPPTLTRQRN